MSTTSTVIKFKAFSFRRQPTPQDEVDKRMYYAIVNIKDVPAVFEEWRALNVRDPKESRKVPKEITDSLINDPENFFVKNRGLLILSEKVSFDNQTNEVELTFSDKAMHGLADGGHTNRAIRNRVDGLPADEIEDLNAAFVRIEFLEGYKTREEVVPIIEARNNSTPVPEQSFQELRGAYESIKKAVAGKDYEKRIFYKQYEQSVDGVEKDINVTELLSYLLCFDIEEYDAQKHPMKAYSSTKASVDHFAFSEKDKTRKQKLDQLVPLLPKILELHDRIYRDFPETYNAETNGRFGLIRGVVRISNKMKETELPFIGATSEYRIPSGFIFPVLAAFRCLVKEDAGAFSWKVADPIDFYENMKSELLPMVGEQAIRIGNPNQIGKDIGTYKLCYQSVELAALKQGLK